MIITVTMNPAIDRTAYIDWIKEGELNRIGHTETDAGGKGINVSKVLNVLDEENVAVAMVGGDTGRLLRNRLESAGIRTDLIEISGPTRINEKVVEESGRMTEFNEPGPLLRPEELAAFQDKLLSYAGKGNLFILSGSVPRGVNTYYYKELIQLLHEHESAVLLDSDGSLFKTGMEAHPDIIKPNSRELLTYFGLSPKHAILEDELLELSVRLQAQGQKMFAISLGKSGALFCSGSSMIRCPGLSIDANSPVGAGDAMVASLAYGWQHQLPLEETARLAMAASAGAATTRGTQPPDLSVIEALKPKVELLQL